ncbi:MAG: MATE family efflux transporter [Planctomycetaceae bacterium]|nr:MATE family efflux transporter [Planctomycetaceae bacterium]
MTFIDRVFLKWESGEAMAAAFSSSMLWFTLLCMPLGTCMYCATFVSQYFGNHQPQRIGPAVWQGVWLSICFSPLLLAAIPFAPLLFSFAQHPETVTQLEIIYFQILCCGAPAMLIAQAFCSFYAGQGQTRIMMCVDSLVAIVNLVLDYLWIFGKAGFPAMGIAGAGYATVVALWLKALIYALLVLQRHHRVKFSTGNWKLDPSLLRRLLYYGAPSGFQFLIDVLGFTVFVVLVGRLGAIEAEASSMAFSISTLSFMPIWGFSQAAAILVGQYLGENRDDLAARGTWTSLQIALTYMTVISVLYLTVPQLFLKPFFLDTPEGQNYEIWIMSLTLLRFVAAYNMLDATMMIFVNAIKGAGDTPFVLKVSGVMASLMMLGSWLVVEKFHGGIYSCWALLTSWVWSVGVIYAFRFLGGKWRTMRVIEQQPVNAESGQES